MTDSRSRNIFNIRSQIEDNKKKGYIVQPLTYLGKEAVRIECKSLKISFLIYPEALADFRGRWLRHGLGKFIPFYEWLLKTEVD